MAAGQQKAGEAYDAAKGKAGEYADDAQVRRQRSLLFGMHGIQQICGIWGVSVQLSRRC